MKQHFQDYLHSKVQNDMYVHDSVSGETNVDKTENLKQKSVELFSHIEALIYVISIQIYRLLKVPVTVVRQLILTRCFVVAPCTESPRPRLK